MKKVMRVSSTAASMFTALLFVAGVAQAQVMMSPEWAQNACTAWNAEPTLTDKLAESEWIKNDAGRGFKIMQIYRTDCENSPRVEMRIVEQNGKAMCVYGGAVETQDLIKKSDYIMHATTKRWQEMGAGKYGPMRAMMFGRLKFTGPKGEAMSNMGPFKAFLRIPGKIPGDVNSCP